MVFAVVSRLGCKSSHIYRFPMSSCFLKLFKKPISQALPPTSLRHIIATNKCSGIQGKDLNSQENDSSQELAVWTIPNILCGLRISAAPLLSYYIIDHSYITSVSILTIAGLTDLADGYIARNFKGQSSRLGSFLDPLADKILIITLYSSMAYANLIPVELMGVIVLRDVLLLSAGMYIRYISIPPVRTMAKYFDSSFSAAKLHPTYLSKVNTVLQIAVAAISLYAPATSWITDDTLSVLWYAAGFSTIISGLSYVFSKNTFVIFRSSTRSR